MDGQPLVEWFKPAYRHSHPIVWAEEEGMAKMTQEEPAYTGREPARVEARPRDLGCLD